jgi:hypothetical protein
VIGGFAVRLDYADGLVLFGLFLTVFAFAALAPAMRYERALLQRSEPEPGPVAAP